MEDKSGYKDTVLGFVGGTQLLVLSRPLQKQPQPEESLLGQIRDSAIQLISKEANYGRM